VCRRVIAVLALLFIASGASAQSPSGAIVGTVTDQTGAAIDSAHLRAERADSRSTHTSDVDASGRFRLAPLEPGTWRVRVEATGFAPAERSVDVTVNGEADLRVTLALAGMTATVRVDANASAIERRRPDHTVVIDERTLNTLPLAGRNFVDAVKLVSQVAPGRENIGGGAFKEPDAATGPAAAPRLSFSGQSELSTSVLVDGLEATQTVTGLPRATPSQEAVDQFRVLSSPYQAEYGRALGGFVNIVTRAGTATPSGIAYGYALPGALAARSALSGPAGDRLRHGQFGGSGGGPLGMTGATWFANYEGQRRREANRFSQVIVTNLDLLNQSRAALGLPPERLDQLRTTDYDQAFIRLDRSGGRSHTTVRVSGLAADTNNFPGGGGRASPASSAARNSETHDVTAVAAYSRAIGSDAHAEFRIQVANRRFEYAPTTSEPALEISNLVIMGKTTSDLDEYRERRVQIAGAVEISRGSHLLKLGGDGTWLRDRTAWQLFFPARIIFPSLDAFSRLTPAVFWWPQLTTTTTHPGNDPAWRTAVPAGWEDDTWLDIPHAAASAFIQDQWSFTDSLTFSAGLRYDVEAYPKPYITRRDANNLQPRLGLAWAYRERGVIRAGYGLFTDRLATSIGQMFLTTAWNSRGTLTGATDLFPTVAQVLGRFSPLTVRGAEARDAMLRFFATGQVPAADRATPALADNLNSHLRNPYAHHASVQIEQELVGSVVVGVAGEIVAARDIAAHTPNLNAFETAVLPSGKARLGGRYVPALGDFFVQDNIGRSTHAGLTLTAHRRLRGAASVLAGYTWSKTISTSDSLANVADFPAGLDLNAERALARQHVGHRLTTAIAGIAPFPSGPVSPLRLSGVLTMQSGRPFTIFAGSDVNGDGNPNSDRAGLLGRGTLIGPGYAAVDLQAAWPILAGPARIELLVDVFNVLNHTNVRDLNTVWGSDDLSRTPDALLRFNSPRDVFNPRQIQIGARVEF
jgi:Carboxypeptidase regulatory-like domain/TonB dependent receptor-like, beta-barrel